VTDHETSRTRRFFTTSISCGLFLLAGACANASSHRSNSPSELVREPWDQIIRGSDATTLLIDVFRSTNDRSSPCFVRYTTRIVAEAPDLIRIELLKPNPEGRPFGCPAKGVRGPFLVSVHLKNPYGGQRLVDATTGSAHAITHRSELL